MWSCDMRTAAHPRPPHLPGPQPQPHFASTPHRSAAPPPPPPHLPRCRTSAGHSPGLRAVSLQSGGGQRAANAAQPAVRSKHVLVVGQQASWGKEMSLSGGRNEEEVEVVLARALGGRHWRAGSTSRAGGDWVGMAVSNRGCSSRSCAAETAWLALHTAAGPSLSVGGRGPGCRAGPHRLRAAAAGSEEVVG